MAWSYDPNNLDNTTAEGRKNTVRLLIGDTDTNDQQLQDEEINYSLSLNNDDIYSSAIWSCRNIAAIYARRVTTEVDGALKAEYSSLKKHYESLAKTIDETKKSLAPTLGSYFGGTTEAQKVALFESPTRNKPSFYVGQWDYYNPYDTEE